MSQVRVFLGIALLGAALLWVGAGSGQGQAQPASGATAAKIGVVNLERAFENSKRKAVLEQELEAELKSRLSKLEALEGEIKKAKQSLNLVEAGSPQHMTYQEQIAVKTAKLKFYDERFRGELQKRRVASFERIYDEIRQVTAEVATELGLDLVLQQTLTIDDKMPSWESVIFTKPRFDITAQVLERLNSK